MLSTVIVVYFISHSLQDSIVPVVDQRSPAYQWSVVESEVGNVSCVTKILVKLLYTVACLNIAYLKGFQMAVQWTCDIFLYSRIGEWRGSFLLSYYELHTVVMACCVNATV